MNIYWHRLFRLLLMDYFADRGFRVEVEGIDMPYTMEQFRKDYIKARLGELDPEERLRGLKAEEVLSQFESEDLLKGIGLEEIEAFLKEMKRRKKH